MTVATITNRLPAWLPKLTATALVCWVLGTNTYFDGKNTSPASWSVPVAQEAQSAPLPANSIPSLQVLSPQDADLYRSIFAAQAQGDDDRADLLIGRLGDRRLLGHVLADRYQRRTASNEELQSWLKQYADLPQAVDIYEKAIAVAGKNDAVPAPAALGRPWTGSNSYGTSFDFRDAVADRKAGNASRRLIDLLNRDLHRNNPSAAESLLEKERHHRSMSAHEVAQAQGLVAARFFYNGQTAPARRLADAALPQQNPLALWIGGLAAWKQNDAAAAGNFFVKLSAQPDLSAWDRTAAEFWAARALKRAGDSKNAAYWLAEAARSPHSFYGLMAAHLLGEDKSWSWDVPALNAPQIAALTSEKSGWRALALLQIGKRQLAESELRHLNPQGRHDLQNAMLALAAAEHLPSLALQLGGVATKADGEPYDGALYPLPPWQPVEGFKMDPALLYALMRHESQFNPLAVSTRGACGLMQLLPATAKLMADNGNDKITAGDCSGRLLDPTVNMTLGQEYMLHLTGQPLIGDNLLLVLAAYNGGPGKLVHWLDNGAAAPVRGHGDTASRRDYEKQDPLLFLESLPLRQTHDYIEQVLMHYWFYRARLGEPETSLAALAHGQWPRVAPQEKMQPLPKGVRDAVLPGGIVKVASSQNP